MVSDKDLKRLQQLARRVRPIEGKDFTAESLHNQQIINDEFFRLCMKVVPSLLSADEYLTMRSPGA